MKNIFRTLIVAIALWSLPVVAFSQNARDPGDPPNGGPGGGGDPVGGSTPVGTGVVILSTLAISYGGKKVYKLLNEEDE